MDSVGGVFVVLIGETEDAGDGFLADDMLVVIMIATVIGNCSFDLFLGHLRKISNIFPRADEDCFSP